MAGEITFHDRVAIVTGAGRGIGRAEAIDLARRGASVIVNDVNRKGVDETIRLIRALGGKAVGNYESVATAEGGQGLTDQAVSRFNRVDIVVNNAGLARPGWFEDLSDEQVDLVLDVNLKAVYHVTRPAWRLMKEQGYGRVINTGSGVGLFGVNAQSNYATAKAGLYGLTKVLAFEGLEHGITANLVLPLAESQMVDQTPIPDVERYAARYLAGHASTLAARGRPPGLIADLVTYLASSDCVVTGEAFSAGYGRFARVFVAIAQGWMAPDVEEVTAESIAEHIDEIRDIEHYTVPEWFWDELVTIAERLQSV